MTKWRIFMILLLILPFFFDALFIILRTEENHNLMCFLSIIVCVIPWLFLVFYFSVIFKPRKSIYKLCNKPSNNLRIEIVEISDITTRYVDLECIEIKTNEKKYFVPTWLNIDFEAGATYDAKIVSNVVLELNKISDFEGEKNEENN